MQKRNWRTNCVLVSLPPLFCLSLLLAENMLKSLGRADGGGGRRCGNIGRRNVASVAPLDSRAVRDMEVFGPLIGADLPGGSCKRRGACPVTVLITGNNIKLLDKVHSLSLSLSVMPLKKKKTI